MDKSKTTAPISTNYRPSEAFRIYCLCKKRYFYYSDTWVKYISLKTIILGQNISNCEKIYLQRSLAETKPETATS